MPACTCGLSQLSTNPADGKLDVVVASPDHQPEAPRCDNGNLPPEASDPAPGTPNPPARGLLQPWPARRRQPGGSAPSDRRCPAAALLVGARASEALLLGSSEGMFFI